MIVKKSVLAVLVLTSAAAQAGTIGEKCTKTNPYLPCEAKMWSVGAQALYLKPDLNTINVRGLRTLADGKQQYVNYDANYQWGFMVNAGYQFSTGRDVNLNWYHVQSTQSREFGAIKSNAGDALASAYGSISPKWNAANVEVGQQLNFTDLQTIRVHAGVQYAQIALDETRIASVIRGADLLNNTAYINRVFNGFGPRIGSDLSQHWNNGLGAYGKMAASMLVGTQNSNTGYRALYPGRTIKMSTIVPELELKLGVDYSHSLANGYLTAEAGWMWANYFNATLHDNYNLLANSVNVNKADFGLQGLFFGLKWAGNII